jgi:hypothetical protein
MRTGDVIQGALNYWDRHGWCRGSITNGRGACAVGALQQAMFGHFYIVDPVERAQYLEMVEVVARYLPDGYVGDYACDASSPNAGERIAGYNDEKGYRAIREVFEKAMLNEGVTL